MGEYYGREGWDAKIIFKKNKIKFAKYLLNILDKGAGYGREAFFVTL